LSHIFDILTRNAQNGFFRQFFDRCGRIPQRSTNFSSFVMIQGYAIGRGVICPKISRCTFGLTESIEKSVPDPVRNEDVSEHKDPDEPEAADERGRGADEEGRQTLRNRLLQKQSPVLAARH
jgi:hypothetical protein